ncbi:MAG TPA: NAD(P)H-binding protein [Jatrophihabitans sp.]|jgi:nucleoside-diphosphate-sugar epimerase|nr:NAD(P)H-binding protein [Jatrophihabitans sp.]
MRVFLAGASGVIGQLLIPLLVADGHDVAGMTRTPSKAARLRELGAEPVMCDVFDAAALRAAVVAFQPEVVLHQLTDLPDDGARLPDSAPANDRMRTEGTRILLAAAAAANARRFLAQSIAWRLPPERQAAVDEFEHAVLAAGGVVLRYGQFYGPGTYFEAALPPEPRVHVADAARRTVPLLDAPSGVIVVVDER